MNQAIQAYAETSATNLLTAFNIFRTLLAALFLAMGPLFGLSKDLQETKQIRFRTTLTWIRQKGLKFTSAGLVETLIVMGPIFTLVILTSSFQYTVV